jgi:hypothetical protein
MKRRYHDSNIAAASTPDSPSAVVARLRKLKPLIARHGTRDQKVAFNAAMSAAKGKRFDTCDSKYGYGPAAKPRIEAQQFADMAGQYHRKNALEVQLQRPSGLLG